MDNLINAYRQPGAPARSQGELAISDWMVSRITFALGYAAASAGKGDPELRNVFLRLANDLHAGDPYWVPYKIPETGNPIS